MTYFIDTILEPALWFLADWSLRWAVLIGVLAVGLAVFRPRRAATRSLVCWVVFWTGLLLPALPRWGGGFALPGPRQEVRVILPDETAMPEEGIQAPAVERHVALPEVIEPFPELLPTVERPFSAERSDTPPPVEPLGPRRALVLGLAAFWLVGVLVLLTRWLGGRLFLERMRRAAQPLGGASSEVFAACRAELGLRRRAVLVTHQAVRSPITLGLWHPTILVPPTWPELPVSVQRGSLLHELAHLTRYDDWAALVLELVRVAFFFHPLLHWLLGRLECERELLCDEAVLARGVDARDYAQMLLEFSRSSDQLLPAAFAGPPYPLGFGRRRTVKIRIHQLLEENMIRWRSPLPLGRALVVGTVVLGLAAILGSFRVRALEPEVEHREPGTLESRAPAEKQSKPEAAPKADQKPAPPAVKKEWLRYGGKSFNEWRSELATELKPDLRVEGIKALSTFGVNGYGEEAARAILEVVRAYDLAHLDREDGGVITAARQAMSRIGLPALRVLLDELKSTRLSDRRFAVEALRNSPLNSKAALPALLEATKDENPYIGRVALEVLRGIDPEGEAFASAFARALKAPDPDTRRHAVEMLGSGVSGSFGSGRDRSFGAPDRRGSSLTDTPDGARGGIGFPGPGRIRPVSDAVIPVLLEALKDKDQQVRREAASALRNLKPDPKRIVPALVGALKDEDLLVRQYVVQCLQAMGPDARQAVRALMAALKDEDYEVRRTAALALGNIGPDAKEAMPALIELVGLGDRQLAGAAKLALSKINK